MCCIWLYTWCHCSCIITRRVISYLSCPRRNAAETYLLKSRTYMRWVVSFSVLVENKSNTFSKNCVSHFQRFLLDVYFFFLSDDKKSLWHRTHRAFHVTACILLRWFSTHTLIDFILNQPIISEAALKKVKLVLEIINTNDINFFEKMQYDNKKQIILWHSNTMFQGVCASYSACI